MFRTTQTSPASTGRSEVCPGAGVPTDRGADESLDASGQELLEAAFRAWVEGHAKADVLVLGTRDPVAVPLERSLHRLATYFLIGEALLELDEAAEPARIVTMDSR
jgi:hypothetical protein